MFHSKWLVLLVSQWILFTQASFEQQEYIVNANYKIQYAIIDETTLDLVVTANTSGWVGFGFGSNRNMAGADLLIGGVEITTPYVGDYFATQNGMPIADNVQDWTAHSISENGNRTVMHVSRALNTSDITQDIAIVNETMILLWAFGSTDDPSYHGVNRGFYELNLFEGPPGPTSSPPPPSSSNPEFTRILYQSSLPSWPTEGTTLALGIHANTTDEAPLRYELLTGFPFLTLNDNQDIVFTDSVEAGAFVGPNNVMLVEIAAYVDGDEDRVGKAVVSLVFPRGCSETGDL